MARSAIVVLAAAAAALAGSTDDWKGKVIYQLLTDRFARTDGSTSPCGNIAEYCGGTYQGAIPKLDYITGLGCDAVWISPIPRQIDSPNSFHGYWASTLTTDGKSDGLNRHFGSAADLTAFVAGMHAKGMYAMLDVVGNHMGGTIGDIGGFYPFNESAHYHDCSACPANCQIDFNANNQQEVELCRLAGLPDLNQSVPFVSQYLGKWAAAQVTGYGFDGLRVDTVPEVDMPFWRSFQAAAGVYAVGEVFNGAVGYVAPYQGGALPGILSYPLFFTMRNVFAQQQPMTQLQDTLKAYSAFQDVDALGTFLDNHDNPRFLYVRNDQTAYKAALTFMIMTRGIPIVYYGSEQGFSGGPDPGCREPLWTSGYDTTNGLYQHIKTVIGVRQAAKLWTLDQVQRYADGSFYAFSRGQVLVATTNVGSGGAQQKRSITYGAGTTWPVGCVLENVFFPTTDKITVQASGFEVYLDGGESKIYQPVSGC